MPESLRLDLRNQGLTKLQLSIHLEADYKILDVSQNPELCDMIATKERDFDVNISDDSLEIVFASDTGFHEFPQWLLSRFPKLKMIAFKTSLIKEIPEDAFALKNNRLAWLILTNNDLRVLPKSIGNLVHLRKLSLAGNMLDNLPNNMENCQSLELLRLGNNLLKEVPYWLWRLPKLTWLGVMGNPAFPCRIHFSDISKGISDSETETAEQFMIGLFPLL